MEKFIPRPHQKRAIKFLVENPRAGLFLEPGLGKTSCTLAAYRILRERDLVGRALIIAPLRVCYEVWPREIAKWDAFQFLSWRILHNKTKTLDAEPVDVSLINPEGLGWLFGELMRRPSWPYEWLILDESTRFKHTNTQRFKLLKNHLGRFLRRTLLTGTPTPNGLLDLFGQVYCLDDGAALGRFITRYRAEFFYPSGYGGYEWKPQADAQDRIEKRIKHLTLAMTAEDWLKLPQRIDNVIHVDLPPEARKVYNDLERDLIAQLEADVVTAKNEGVASMKCRQVANGGLYRDMELEVSGKKRVAHQIHDAKVDALESLVEELQGSPLLCAYEFGHDLERIRARFGPKTPALSGGQSMVESKKIVDAWNAGQLPLLLVQPQSAAFGLNLQESGHTVCFFGMIWDFEIYDQLIKRIWRDGQRATRVVIHHIVARNTVDEDILDGVRNKERRQRDLLHRLKQRLSGQRRR